MTATAYEKTPILDSGYVQLIETWGSDERIVEAARMSTDKGFIGFGPLQCSKCAGSEVPGTEWVDLKQGWVDGTLGDATRVMQQCSRCNGTTEVPGDEKLLAYLYRNKHSTPFEMAGMTIEVQAPIFVFREWHRHRTQSYSELSARYTPMPDLFYMPSDERLATSAQSTTNKQGSGVALDPDVMRSTKASLHACYREARERYEWMLAHGVAREVARCVLPVAQYSRMRASANLRNWLGFLTLRMDKAAQFEIRQYANEVANVVAQHFPRTYALFSEGK